MRLPSAAGADESHALYEYLQRADPRFDAAFVASTGGLAYQSVLARRQHLGLAGCPIAAFATGASHVDWQGDQDDLADGRIAVERAVEFADGFVAASHEAASIHGRLPAIRALLSDPGDQVQELLLALRRAEASRATGDESDEALERLATVVIIPSVFGDSEAIRRVAHAWSVAAPGADKLIMGAPRDAEAFGVAEAKQRGWRHVSHPFFSASAALNQALNHARGRFLLFPDPRTLPKPGGLTVIVRAAIKTGSRAVSGLIEARGAVAAPGGPRSARTLPQDYLLDRSAVSAARGFPEIAASSEGQAALQSIRAVAERLAGDEGVEIVPHVTAELPTTALPAWFSPASVGQNGWDALHLVLSGSTAPSFGRRRKMLQLSSSANILYSLSLAPKAYSPVNESSSVTLQTFGLWRFQWANSSLSSQQLNVTVNTTGKGDLSLNASSVDEALSSHGNLTGTTISFSAPSSLIPGAIGAIKFTGFSNQFGVEQVTVRITQASGANPISISFTFTIHAVNGAPTLTPPGPFNTTQNVPVTIPAFSFSDPDAAESLNSDDQFQLNITASQGLVAIVNGATCDSAIFNCTLASETSLSLSVVLSGPNFRSDLRGDDSLIIQVEDLGSSGATRNYIGNGDATGPGATWSTVYPWEIRRLGWDILPAGSGRSAPVNISRAFVASDKGASRSQTVDLYARHGTPSSVLETRPVIRVGEYVACTLREDTFYFRVEIRDAANHTMMHWDSREANKGNFNSTSTDCSRWHFVGATFDLKQNMTSLARFVYIEDGGTDGENWVGNFGPRFTDAFLWLSQEARGTVNVTVHHRNQPPVASDVFTVVDAGATSAINLTCSDPDPEDQPASLQYSTTGLRFSTLNSSSYTAISTGTLSAPLVGSIAASYTPPSTGYALVSFNFSCTDTGSNTRAAASSLSASAVATVAVNDLPMLAQSRTSTPENVVTVVWLNFTDAYIAPGHRYTISVLSLPASGTLQHFPGGVGYSNLMQLSTVDASSWIVSGTSFGVRLIYVPARNVNGTFSFTYSVSDGRLSASGTAFINVTENATLLNYTRTARFSSLKVHGRGTIPGSHSEISRTLDELVGVMWDDGDTGLSLVAVSLLDGTITRLSNLNATSAFLNGAAYNPFDGYYYVLVEDDSMRTTGSSGNGRLITIDLSNFTSTMARAGATAPVLGNVAMQQRIHNLKYAIGPRKLLGLVAPRTEFDSFQLALVDNTTGLAIPIASLPPGAAASFSHATFDANNSVYYAIFDQMKNTNASALEMMAIDVRLNTTVEQGTINDRVAYLQSDLELCCLNTIPRRSYAWGPGLDNARSNYRTHFWIQARDMYYRNVTFGRENITVFMNNSDWLGDSRIDLWNRNKTKSINMTVENGCIVVTDLLNGTYHVEYTPDTDGIYVLSIKINHEHIVGSPRTVIIRGWTRGEGPKFQYGHWHIRNVDAGQSLVTGRPVSYRVAFYSAFFDRNLFVNESWPIIKGFNDTGEMYKTLDPVRRYTGASIWMQTSSQLECKIPRTKFQYNIKSEDEQARFRCDITYSGNMTEDNVTAANYTCPQYNRVQYGPPRAPMYLVPLPPSNDPVAAFQYIIGAPKYASPYWSNYLSMRMVPHKYLAALVLSCTGCEPAINSTDPSTGSPLSYNNETMEFFPESLAGNCQMRWKKDYWSFITDEHNFPISTEVANLTTQHIPACNASELADLKREMNDTLEHYAAATTPQQLRQMEMLVSTLQSRTVYIACKDMLDRFSVYGANQTKPVPATTFCNETVGTSSWSANPCCNLSRPQCCKPREVTASIFSLDNLHGLELNVSSSPVLAGREAIQAHADNVSAADPAMGCSAATRRALGGDSAMVFNERLRVFNICVVAIFGRKSCSFGGQCYSGRCYNNKCVPPSIHNGAGSVEYAMQKCIEEASDDEMYIEIKTDLGLAFNASSEEVAMKIRDQATINECTGPGGDPFQMPRVYSRDSDGDLVVLNSTLMASGPNSGNQTLPIFYGIIRRAAAQLLQRRLKTDGLCRLNPKITSFAKIACSLPYNAFCESELPKLANTTYETPIASGRAYPGLPLTLASMGVTVEIGGNVVPPGDYTEYDNSSYTAFGLQEYLDYNITLHPQLEPLRRTPYPIYEQDQRTGEVVGDGVRLDLGGSNVSRNVRLCIARRPDIHRLSSTLVPTLKGPIVGDPPMKFLDLGATDPRMGKLDPRYEVPDFAMGEADGRPSRPMILDTIEHFPDKICGWVNKTAIYYPIMRSPWRFNATAYGPNKYLATAGVNANFTLQSRDYFLRNRTVGGKDGAVYNCTLKLQGTPPNARDATLKRYPWEHQAEIVDLHDGRYQVSFNTRVAGIYTTACYVHFKDAWYHIVESPWNTYVQAAPTTAITTNSSGPALLNFVNYTTPEQESLRMEGRLNCINVTVNVTGVNGNTTERVQQNCTRVPLHSFYQEIRGVPGTVVAGTLGVFKTQARDEFGNFQDHARDVLVFTVDKGPELDFTNWNLRRVNFTIPKDFTSPFNKTQYNTTIFPGTPEYDMSVDVNPRVTFNNQQPILRPNVSVFDASAGYGRWNMTFNATVAGLYTVTLRVNGEQVMRGGDIMRSPYNITVLPAEPHAPTTFAEEEGTVFAIAGTYGPVIIYGQDRFQNLPMRADASFNMSLYGPSKNVTRQRGSVNGTCIERGHLPGVFDCQYNATVTGNYTMDLLLHGREHIRASPYSVWIYPNETDGSRTTFNEPEALVAKLDAGTTISFSARARDAFDNYQNNSRDFLRIVVVQENATSCCAQAIDAATIDPGDTCLRHFPTRCPYSIRPSGNYSRPTGSNDYVHSYVASDIRYEEGVDGGLYRFTFTPTVAGVYKIYVAMNSRNATTGPLTTIVYPKQGTTEFDISKCQAWGSVLDRRSGKRAEVASPWNIYVNVSDTFWNIRPIDVASPNSTATIARLKAVMYPLSDLSKTPRPDNPTNIEYDWSTAYYLVNFYEERRGFYLIDVTLDGQPLVGSPYTVEVVPPRTSAFATTTIDPAAAATAETARPRAPPSYLVAGRTESIIVVPRDIFLNPTTNVTDENALSDIEKSDRTGAALALPGVGVEFSLWIEIRDRGGQEASKKRWRWTPAVLWDVPQSGGTLTGNQRMYNMSYTVEDAGEYDLRIFMRIKGGDPVVICLHIPGVNDCSYKVRRGSPWPTANSALKITVIPDFPDGSKSLLLSPVPTRVVAGDFVAFSVSAIDAYGNVIRWGDFDPENANKTQDANGALIPRWYTSNNRTDPTFFWAAARRDAPDFFGNDVLVTAGTWGQNVFDWRNGTYTLRINATRAGMYTVNVGRGSAIRGGATVQGSGFRIKVEPGPMSHLGTVMLGDGDPEKPFYFGNGLTTLCNAQYLGIDDDAYFTIFGRDRFENDVETTNDAQNLRVNIEFNNTIISSNVTNGTVPGRYIARYTPQTKGRYRITTFHNGSAILPGSVTACVWFQNAPSMKLAKLSDSAFNLTIIFSNDTDLARRQYPELPDIFDCNVVLEEASVATLGRGAQCSWLSRRALDISIGGQANFTVLKVNANGTEGSTQTTELVLKEKVIYGNYRASEYAAGSSRILSPDNPPPILLGVGAPRSIGACAGAPLTSFVNPEAALSRAWTSITWTLKAVESLPLNASRKTKQHEDSEIRIGRLFAEKSAVAATDFEIPSSLLAENARYSISVRYENFIGKYREEPAIMTKTDELLPEVRILDPLQIVKRSEGVRIVADVNGTSCPTNVTSIPTILSRWELRSATYSNGDHMLVSEYSNNATANAREQLAPLLAVLAKKSGALSPSLFIPARVLGPGAKYEFRLNVTVIRAGGNFSAEAFSKIEVTTSNLMVKVAGGDKSVSASQPFVMQAIPLDPDDDVSATSYEGAIFTWSCRTIRFVQDRNILLNQNSTDVIVPEVVENVCRGRDGNPAPQSTRYGNDTLEFPKNYFFPSKENEVLEFTVSMTKTSSYWRLAARSPATATARVQILPGDAPTIQILVESPVQAQASGIIRAADRLVLLAYVEQFTGTRTYRWNCTVNGNHFDLSSIALNGATTDSYLTIEPNKLLRGFTYRFRAEVTDDNANPAYSEREIEINTPARFCNIFSSPMSGVALQTTFFFDVRDCVTKSKLRYRFRANYDPSNVGSATETLGLGDNSAILPFKASALEPGKQQLGDIYPVNITAIVLDDLDDEANFTLRISVAPTATFNITDVEKYVAMIGITQLTSGDPGTVVQMISVVVGVLNDALDASTPSNLGSVVEREEIREDVMKALESAIDAIVGDNFAVTPAFMERQGAVVTAIVNKTEEVTPTAAYAGIRILDKLVKSPAIDVNVEAGISFLHALSALLNVTDTARKNPSNSTIVKATDVGGLNEFVKGGQQSLHRVVTVITGKIAVSMPPNGPPITITSFFIAVTARRQTADAFMSAPSSLVAPSNPSSTTLKPNQKPTTVQLPSNSIVSNKNQRNLRLPNGRVLLVLEPLSEAAGGFGVAAGQPARRHRALADAASREVQFVWLPADLDLLPPKIVPEPETPGPHLATRSVARRANVPQWACTPRQVDGQATFSSEFFEFLLDPHGWTGMTQTYTLGGPVAGLNLHYRPSGAPESAVRFWTEQTTCGDSYKFSFECSAAPALNATPSCEFFNETSNTYRPEGVILLNATADGTCTCAATHLTDFAVLLRDPGVQYSNRVPFDKPRLVLDAFYQGNTYAPWIVGSIYLLYLFFAFVGYRWDRKQRLRWKLRLLHGPDAELLDPDESKAAAARARAKDPAGEPGAAPALLPRSPSGAARARYLTPAERWELVRSNRELAGLFLTHRQRMRLLLADPALATAGPLRRWYEAWRHELAERHIVLGIFLVHPTDAFTRPRRLTVLLCALTGCLALSAIWFGSRWPSHGPPPADGYPTPAVGVWVSLCLAPVYYALAFLFRRVHPRIARRVGPVPPDLTADAFVAAPRRVKPLPAHPGLLLTRSRHAGEAMAPRPASPPAPRRPSAACGPAWRPSGPPARRRQAPALHPRPAPAPRPKPSGAARVGPRPPPLPEGLVVRRAQAARGSREGLEEPERAHSPEPSDPKRRPSGLPGELDAGFGPRAPTAPPPPPTPPSPCPAAGPSPAPPARRPVRRARSISQPGSQRGAPPAAAMAPLRRARRARSTQSSEKLDDAAVHMQAAWRGFVTRQALLGRGISVVTPNEARAKWKLPASWKAVEPALAAIRIQAAWRGFLFRHHNEPVAAQTLLAVARARRLRERAEERALEAVRAAEDVQRASDNAKLRADSPPPPRAPAPPRPLPAAPGRPRPASRSRRRGARRVASLWAASRARPSSTTPRRPRPAPAPAPAEEETSFGGPARPRPRPSPLALPEAPAEKGASEAAAAEPAKPAAGRKRAGISMARARPGRAPWFFAYAAYILAFAAALIFGYCAIVYGVSLPKGPTNDAWLESAAIAFIQEALLIEPVVCALLAAYETAIMPAAVRVSSLLTDLRHSLALGD
eukprot:tig00000342_g24216.t1